MQSSNSRGKSKRGKKRHVVAGDVERLAMSVATFCRTHGISESKYFLLSECDRPATMRIGRRVLISTEAAAEWRARMSMRPAA